MPHGNVDTFKESQHSMHHYTKAELKNMNESEIQDLAHRLCDQLGWKIVNGVPKDGRKVVSSFCKSHPYSWDSIIYTAQNQIEVQESGQKEQPI
jgi:hypothetical protein